VPTSDTDAVTIDELAAAAGTTTRRVRSLQTLGLLPHPRLRGRTGLYGPEHRTRLDAVLRLQGRGFSLESLVLLFGALDAGQSLATVLGVDTAPADSASTDGAGDVAELYGFAELQPSTPRARRGRRPLLSVVPTTMWEQSQAEAS
jgi:DNA-binding transcriptional MerR regulator